MGQSILHVQQTKSPFFFFFGGGGVGFKGPRTIQQLTDK